MRFLLAIMAMTLLAVSVGCDQPTTTSNDTPAATAGETQTVSLKLPGMTWGGCVSSVQSALEGIDGVDGIKLDMDNTCGTFTAPADLNVEETLNKLVEGGNEHIKGWSMDE